ncbi:MAG: carboxypeptidase regulatory-like domain-containing protein [Terriglobales bacterium]
MGNRPEVHVVRMKLLSTLAAILGLLLCLAPLGAQNTVSGGVTGRVTDPSGAVLPGAMVRLRNLATGYRETATSNGTGFYHFGYLAPDNYQVTVTAHGFNTLTRTVAVAVGQTTMADFKLRVGATTTTVTVSSEAPVVQTSNGNITTTYTAQQIALVPNPGNDLTAIAQTAPGTTMNTQAGYGNFEAFGLPATSNLFTLNGEDDNDPFLNLNNSGATNLLLGLNDIKQTTVVNNGYTGEYGRLAGSQINYVSKSGSNDWHGNANYFWNGSSLNANNYFNNASGTAKPFSNANQWSWSIGGPIVKNKTFFFVDQEGLYLLIPTNQAVNIPTPQFQAATLANITAADPSQVPFYKTMFGFYNSAAGAASAKNILPAGGCADLGAAFSAAVLGGSPCALQFRSTAGNRTHEWIVDARVDQVLGNNDRLFFQFGTDHGEQATYTDGLNPIFNTQSDQPQYTGQMHETHIFGPDSVNSFILSGMYYSAIFQPANPSATLAAFPTTIDFAGGSLYQLGGEDFDFPQGRNVTQYQLVDDFALTMGNNTIQMGADFRRDITTDYDSGILTSGFALNQTLADFYSGVATEFEQSFPTALEQPINLYNLGVYIQDGWRVSPGLKFTATLRADHNSNPVCPHNCFAQLVEPFTYLAHDVNTPYDAIINPSSSTAYRGYQQWAIQPRLGFAATPFGPQTVIRGGFGLFSDAFPATVTDNFAENFPQENTFVIGGQPLSPAASGNVFATTAADNAALVKGFYSGGTLASITAADPAFTPPNFYTQDVTIPTPMYMEWNLQLQRAIGTTASVSANYVGNDGWHEAFNNNGFNAYCPTATCSSGFAGLPTAPPDARFGTVTQLETGNSNYNGLTLSYLERFSAGLQMQFNYTWSHALDDVSNGGFLPYNFETNTSILNPQDPYNEYAYNYGNSDYDIRHYFSLSYLWQVPFRSFHFGPSELWRGWVVSGTMFFRTGLPYTVIDAGTTGLLGSYNYGATIFGNELSQAQAQPCTQIGVCVASSQFSPSGTLAFGNQIRDQFRGPDFFDTDLQVKKNTQIPGWESAQLGIGVELFNLLNHPNFDQPVGDLASPQFGSVINTVSVPTSILGSFLGGDASPRIIEIVASLNF